MCETPRAHCLCVIVCVAQTWAYRGDELVKTLSVVTLLEWHPGPEWLEAFGNAIRSGLAWDTPTQTHTGRHTHLGRQARRPRNRDARV